MQNSVLGMVNPDGNLMGGFITKWVNSEKAQGEVFRGGVKKNVTLGFDQIIRLENGKVKK